MRRSMMMVVVLAACGGDDRVFVDAAPADAATRDGETAPVDAAVDATVDATPELTAPVTLAPALGTLCGVGYDHVQARIWVYPCNGAMLHAFTATGAAAGTLPRPGEAANDVDIAVAPAPIVVGTTAVAAGGLLFVNGETGTADIHLPDTAASVPLMTSFGASHVVGGGYHRERGTFFVVQDNVPGTSPNTVAELDRTTGAVVSAFSIAPAFDVSYGDLEVCPSSGHLFVVSSIEPRIAELTATGTLVATYPLPANVTRVSGLALGPDGQAWVVGTGGELWKLAGLPCSATP